MARFFGLSSTIRIFCRFKVLYLFRTIYDRWLRNLRRCIRHGFGLQGGKHEVEGAAQVRASALRPDSPLVGFDNSTANRQTEAGAAAAPLCVQAALHELVEDHIDLFGINPLSGIP